MALKQAEKKKLRKQLMAYIDKDNMQQVEKVERYLSYLELDAQLVDDIETEGSQIIVENGSQRFVKTHPAIGERMKINTQLLAIEKSLGLDYQTQAKEQEKAASEPAPAPAKKETDTDKKESNVKPFRPSVADLL